GGTVLTPDGLSVEIPGGGTAVLQQASAASAAVYVATATDLIAVPFDGSEPTAVASGGEGVPAAPVSLLGCAYGAWNGSAKFVRDCIDSGDDLKTDIEGVTAQSQLKFRVNRDVIVLNDIVQGATWLASEALQRVDNWDDLTPPEGEEES